MHNSGIFRTIYLVHGAEAGRLNKKNYDKAFINRVRVARESAGLTRDDVADHLGIKKDTYARYELKIMMPHHLLPKFAALTNVSLAYLFGSSLSSKTKHLKSV